MPEELIQIRKPELGRPNDRRVTQEYIDARPELSGLSPFIEGQDVDLVEEVNTAMQGLHALVTYADPELGPALREVLDVEVPAKLQEMADIIADTAQSSAAALAAAGLQPHYGTSNDLPDIQGTWRIMMGPEQGHVWVRASVGQQAVRDTGLEVAWRLAAEADADLLTLPDALSTAGRARYSQTQTLSSRLAVQEGQAVLGLSGAGIQAAPGYSDGQLIELHTGTTVQARLNGANVAPLTAPWTGAAPPNGTGVSGVGTPTEPLRGITVALHAEQFHGAAAYLTYVEDSTVAVTGRTLSQGGDALSAPAALVIQHGKRLHVSLNAENLGMKGVSVDDSYGINIWADTKNGNNGHAAVFVKDSDAVTVWAPNHEGGFALKFDATARCRVVGGVARNSGAGGADMMQGGTDCEFEGRSILNPTGIGLHLGHHPTRAIGLLRARATGYRIVRDGGKSDDVTKIGINLEAGAGALANDTPTITAHVLGGFQALRQEIKANGRLIAPQITLRAEDVTEVMTLSPIGGHLNVVARRVKRGVTLRGDGATDTAKTLTLDLDIQMDSDGLGDAGKGDIALNIAPTLRCETLIVRCRSRGGRRGVNISVGCDAVTGIPFIQNIILDGLDIKGGSSGTCVYVGVYVKPGDAAQSQAINLHLVNAYGDRRIMLAGNWVITRDFSNRFHARVGFPAGAVATFNGLTPTAGSFAIDQVMENRGIINGSWAHLRVSTAGSEGVLDDVLGTATAGSTQVSVSDLGPLQVGQKIMIAGILASRTITAIDTTVTPNILTVNATSNASGTGQVEYTDKAKYNGSGWIGAVPKATLLSNAAYVATRWPNSQALITDPPAGKSATVYSDGAVWKHAGDNSALA